MIKILKSTLIFLSIFLLILKYSYAINQSDAVKYIENVGQQAINILKTPIEDLQTREFLFERMLNNNFDKKLIHRAVLGKSAKGASKEQLIRFGKAFDKHIVKVYASQLGVYSNQLFIIDKAYKTGKNVKIILNKFEEVNLKLKEKLIDEERKYLLIELTNLQEKIDVLDTIVSSHIEHETAPPLRIDWRLRDRGKGTKIIDIAIEGVSLLKTKRADFGASIKKGGLHSLIIDLETKNAENK